MNTILLISTPYTDPESLGVVLTDVGTAQMTKRR